MENHEEFRYTYSAQEQTEVARIRSKYLPREENKMERLRRLDKSVTQKGMIVSLSVGILGALILGLGMSCTLVWQGAWFVPGIVIGVLGLGLAAAAYPLYRRITQKERQRMAPEILRLADELMLAPPDSRA